MANDAVGKISKAQAVNWAVREMLTRFSVSRHKRNFSFAVVAFDEHASVLMPLTPAAEIDDNGDYDPMRGHGGGTNIGAGMRQAQLIADEFLRSTPDDMPSSVVIVVMSDGLDGDPAGSLRIAEEMKSNPVVTVCTTYFSEVGAVEPAAEHHLRALATYPSVGFKTVYDVETLRKFFIASVSVGIASPPRWPPEAPAHRRGESHDHTNQDPCVRETLVCAVSVTPRPDPEHNEDAGVAICVPQVGLRGVVVADGLGSYSKAGLAARYAARRAAAWLRNEKEHFGRGTLPRLFAQVHKDLRQYARDIAGGGDPEAQAFGTTLLVGLDMGTELVAAYAGNGAIWHIRGNSSGFPFSGLPWNSVNLLNPHSVLHHGREALYNILDAAVENPPVPTVVSVSKDPEFGDILLLCTDGIYSADQVTHRADAGGSVWISAEPAMIAFYHTIRDLFAGWNGEADLPLHHALQSYLAGLRNRGMLEDDATVGVIVTADALRYQQRARAARAVGVDRASDQR